jgi:hypothetical protein
MSKLFSVSLLIVLSALEASANVSLQSLWADHEFITISPVEYGRRFRATAATAAAICHSVGYTWAKTMEIETLSLNRYPDVYEAVGSGSGAVFSKATCGPQDFYTGCGLIQSLTCGRPKVNGGSKAADLMRRVE